MIDLGKGVELLGVDTIRFYLVSSGSVLILVSWVESVDNSCLTGSPEDSLGMIDNGGEFRMDMIPESDCLRKSVILNVGNGMS